MYESGIVNPLSLITLVLFRLRLALSWLLIWKMLRFVKGPHHTVVIFMKIVFYNMFQLLLSFQAKFAIHKADDEHANNDTYIIECQGVGTTNSNLWACLQPSKFRWRLLEVT